MNSESTLPGQVKKPPGGNRTIECRRQRVCQFRRRDRKYVRSTRQKPQPWRKIESPAEGNRTPYLVITSGHRREKPDIHTEPSFRELFLRKQHSAYEWCIQCYF